MDNFRSDARAILGGAVAVALGITATTLDKAALSWLPVEAWVAWGKLLIVLLGMWVPLFGFVLFSTIRTKVRRKVDFPYSILLYVALIKRLPFFGGTGKGRKVDFRELCWSIPPYVTIVGTVLFFGGARVITIRGDDVSGGVVPYAAVVGFLAAFFASAVWAGLSLGSRYSASYIPSAKQLQLLEDRPRCDNR